AKLINCTVSGNSAPHGGGVYSLYYSSLTNSTVSGNSGQVGGGIANYGGTTLANTIVAGQTAGGDIANSNLVTGDNNLIGDGSGISGGTGNLLGTPSAPIDPKLAPLGAYGGPTQTMALLPGSPALDAGSDSVPDATITGLPAATVPTTDQRGAVRGPAGL